MQTVEEDVQDPPEIEQSKRCFIYLKDIRETALFDKYLKNPGEQSNPVEPMTPAPNIEDRSPIEIDDSDEEINNSSSSIDDTAIVISDSE